MKFSPQALRQVLEPYVSAKRWYLGFSGGLDSTALLHALVQLRFLGEWPDKEIIAVHVNHALSVRADQWQQHCKAICLQLGIRFIAEKVTVEAAGEGIEAAARNARFAVFASLLKPEDVLLLAHHRDDQAETLLLRLLRGAGARGLAAMAECRPFAGGKMIRPLLSFSRPALVNYVTEQGLCWLEDDSNRSEQFDRNFLRQSILPQLEARWPQLSRRWSRTAQNLGDNESALADLADIDLQTCAGEAARLGWRVNRSAFAALSTARRHNLVRFWCERHHLPRPEFNHLQRLDGLLDRERADKLAVQWRGAELRSYQQYLYLLPSLIPPSGISQCSGPNLPLAPESILALPDGSELVATKAPGGLVNGLESLEVRWRQGGERSQPNARNHSQTLKKLLQEYALEPWLRDRVPLVYAGDTLVAVADLWIGRGFQAADDQQGLRLRWRYPANAGTAIHIRSNSN